MIRQTALAALAALSLSTAAQAQTLRIGLAEDPDVLDPTLARTFVGRIVFARCATSCSTSTRSSRSCRSSPPAMSGQRRQTLTIKLRRASRSTTARNSTPRRSSTARAPQDDAGLEPPRRARAGRIASTSSTRTTVRLNLSAPFAPLLAQLADRAGMIVSPKAAQAAGRQFRRQAGLRGPVPLRRARRAGPHRASSASPATGIRPTSISTASSTCRSPTRRCAWPTCDRASSTSSSASSRDDIKTVQRRTRSSRSWPMTRSATRASRINLQRPARRRPAWPRTRGCARLRAGDRPRRPSSRSSMRAPGR